MVEQLHNFSINLDKKWEEKMLLVKKLSKEFTIHTRRSVKIVSFENISFQVEKGSLLAITGPSGIGKSSLLKCIYRTYLPTSGEIIYKDKHNQIVDIVNSDDRKIIELRKSEISYVSQFLHVLPRVSALDLLVEPLISKGADYLESENRAKELLSYVGIGEQLWNMYPSTFSGGEKQRLNILKAIITKPRFLLLDEPRASLDLGYKNKVMELINDLKKTGTAMLGVFHDRDAITALSDKRYDLEHKVYYNI